MGYHPSVVVPVEFHTAGNLIMHVSVKEKNGVNFFSCNIDISEKILDSKEDIFMLT